MDVTTGREFKHINPQDDPHLFPRLDPGFRYNHEGQVFGIPRFPVNNNEYYGLNTRFPNESLNTNRIENYKVEIALLQSTNEKLKDENKKLKEQITELKNKIDNLNK